MIVGTINNNGSGEPGDAPSGWRVGQRHPFARLVPMLLFAIIVKNKTFLIVILIN